MTDDRAKSLIIAYKCSSYKRTCFDHNRYVGSSPSQSGRSKFTLQVLSSEFKLKIHTEVANKPLENDQFSNQTHHEPQRNNQNLIQQKRSKLKHRASNDKYDNIIFYVDNHNQE